MRLNNMSSACQCLQDKQGKFYYGYEVVNPARIASKEIKMKDRSKKRTLKENTILNSKGHKPYKVKLEVETKTKKFEILLFLYCLQFQIWWNLS